MNRTQEFAAMMEELNRPVPGLETTVDRALRKRHRVTANRFLQSGATLAACLAVFILLVNLSAPVAYACSQIPVLRDLAAAVTFSPSLSDAVENEYVQPMNLSRTEKGITAEIAYLIVDQKQVNIFYRLDSGEYDRLLATPTVRDAATRHRLSAIISQSSITSEKEVLRCLTVDFTEDAVPESMIVELYVYTPDMIPDSEGYLVSLDFLLEFDPQFTATGRIIPVNRQVLLEDQTITVTDIEIYPTHLRVNIEEDANNTAWLKDLDFYIETDWGMRFEAVADGITATGRDDALTSYRADSTYFHQADRLNLVITGATWLRKDMETTYVNLKTGETGPLPEGVSFHEARREGNGWTVSFRADMQKENAMHQIFRSPYYDAQGNMKEFNQWATILGERDQNSQITYFLEQLYLTDYPYEEVWLNPYYSHRWVSEDLIVIHVQ